MKKSSIVTGFLIVLVGYGNGNAQSKYLAQRLKQLESIKALYQSNLQDNFQLLKNNLLPGKLRLLKDTKLRITLEDNIVFAKTYGDNSIRISAATILFIDELAVTLAWYDFMGNKNTQPIINYILLLRKHYKKNELKRENIPTMPRALGVPYDEIWKRSDTDRTKTFAQNFIKSAVMWILAHEMGHVGLGHFTPAKRFSSSTEEINNARNLESQADDFATNLMARVRLAPIGMALTMAYYPLLFPIRLEFEYEKEWQNYLAEQSHPLWPERFERLIPLFRRHGSDWFNSSVGIEALAKSLENLVELLRAREVLDGMILGSEKLTFQNLMSYEPVKKIDQKYWRPWSER